MNRININMVMMNTTINRLMIKDDDDDDDRDDCGHDKEEYDNRL